MEAPGSYRVPMLLLCVLAAVGVYLNSLGNGFALDDVHIIELNARVHQLGWREIWLTPYWPTFGMQLGLWRPLAVFAFALQWAAGGGDPFVFHLTNILLHAAVTALCFLLLEKLTTTTAAFAGALLFAVHPLHTEAVANIVGQSELIAAAAVLAACLVHATRADGIAVSWPRRAVIGLLFALALLAKENSVILPGLLVIIDLAQRRVRPTVRGFADYADALLMPVLILGSVLAFYLVVRFEVLGGALIGTDAGPTMPFLREEHRVFNALRVVPEYLRLLLFPQDLAAFYAPATLLPVTSVTPMVVAGALLLLSFVVLALTTPWRPAVGFPAAWFLISIVTVSNLFFPIGVLIAERTLYLPSFAFSALLAFAWHSAAPHASAQSRRLAPIALAVAALALGARTWLRNPDWKDTAAVHNAMIRDHPESYHAQWAMGVAFWQQGDIERARFHLELAYRVYPRDSQFLAEYGNFLLDNGEPDRAIQLLQESVRLHDFVPRTTMLLAYAYLTQQRYADALPVVRRAQLIGAGNASTLPLLAYAYEGVGDRNRATAAWRLVLQHSPISHWTGWAALARMLALSGYDDEAATALAKARAATADSAALDVLRSAERALRDGCYDQPVSADDAAAFRTLGGILIRVPSCDPLEPALAGAGATQNANPLHNARQPARPGAAPASAGIR